MRTGLFFLLLGVASSLSAACSVPGEDVDALDADELTAMAAPGADESAMNRAADPCTDFYEFACGGYVASQPADAVFVRRNSADLRKANALAMKQVIEALQNAPRTVAERKAGIYYKACMRPSDPAETIARAKAIRAEVEAATSPADVARVVGHIAMHGIPVFFQFLAGEPSSIGRGRYGSANVTPGGFDYGTQYDKPESVAERVKGLVATIGIAEPSLSSDAASELATKAVRIEGLLAGAAQAFEGTEHPHPIGAAGLAAATPHFDWKTFFATIGATRLGDFPVNPIGYFAALDDVLGSTPASDLTAYLTVSWYATVPRGPVEAGFCQTLLSYQMGDAIEPRFLDIVGVDAKARSKARAMFRAIVDAFDEQLEQETFLDVPTRVEARVKLMKMRGAIGGSRDLDTFDDLQLDPNDSFETNVTQLGQRAFRRGLDQVGRRVPLLHIDWPAATVNASYSSSINAIQVPGGILGGYFFSAAAPKLANFAAIGSVLGHELTHGFDDNGRRFDGDGVERDWWTAAVSHAYDERARCLADQYSAFTLPGVVDPHTGVAPAHIDGKQTLGENIADNGGIKIAYRASKVESLTAPIVAGLTPQQQFFVAYAQLWCEKSSPEHSAEALQEDSHSPGKARVNVPLRNFDAFAKAFQCQPGGAMAPANRCSVW